MVSGMDLTSPLRSLTPSLESAVLEVLARTESGLNAVQIAKLSRRGTRTGQRPVLDRLVDHGLVLAHPANTGFLYQLNRDHVLASAVLAAVSAREEILARLSAACAALDPLPVHASVFGSFARREADQDSDIDLLLVVGDDVDVHDGGWADQLERLEDLVVSWTGNRLETLVFTVSRLSEVVTAQEPIVRAWATDAVTVLGEDPDHVLAGARSQVR